MDLAVTLTMPQMCYLWIMTCALRIIPLEHTILMILTRLTISPIRCTILMIPTHSGAVSWRPILTLLAL